MIKQFAFQSLVQWIKDLDPFNGYFDGQEYTMFQSLVQWIKDLDSIVLGNETLATQFQSLVQWIKDLDMGGWMEISQVLKF